MATLQVQQIQSLPDLGHCPECGGRTFETNGEGFQVCIQCGLVDDVPSYREDAHETWGQGWLTDKKEWARTVHKHQDGRGEPLTARQEEKYNHLHFRDLQFRLPSRDPKDAAMHRLRGKLKQLPLAPPVRSMALATVMRVLKEHSVQNTITTLAACVLHATRKISPGALTIQQCIEMFTPLGHGVNARLIRKAWEESKTILGPVPVMRTIHYLERIVTTVAGIPRLWSRVQSKTACATSRPYNTINDYLQSLRAEAISILKETTVGGTFPFNMMAAIIYCADKVLAYHHGYIPILTQEQLGQATSIPAYSIRDLYTTCLKPVFISQKWQERETMENEPETEAKNETEVNTSDKSPRTREVDPERTEKVFRHLQAHGEGQTTLQVKEALALKHQNYAQLHLVKLMKAGRITRERQGKAYLFFAGTKTPPPPKIDIVNGSHDPKEISFAGKAVGELPTVARFVERERKDNRAAWQALQAAVPAAGSILASTKDYALVAQLGKVIFELGAFLDQHPMPGGITKP